MKSGFGDEYGPNCVLGAIEQVCWNMNSYYSYTVELLLESIGPTGTNVIYFNDHPDTSFDDIINLIDLAIKKEEERAN